MKRILYILLFVVAVVSCNKEEIREDYFNISCNSYFFKAKADSMAIRVSSTFDWSIKTESDWISFDRFADDSLMIRVSENEAQESRKGVLEFVSDGKVAAVFEASQFGKSFNGIFRDLGFLYSMTDPVISKNGKFILGMLEGSSSGYYVPVRINTYTGKITKWEESNEFTGAVAVSDDGNTMIFQKQYNEYKLFKDGVFEKITVPDIYASPRIGNISSDGSVWVGWAQNRSKKITVPLMWINGEVTELEIPEETPQGYPIPAAGIMARDCSADGSVVYGSVWDPASYALVFWRDGKLFYPGKDFYEGTSESLIQKTAESYGLSANGKWLAASSGAGYPVMIDTENYEVEFKSECKDMAGLTFSNDGTMFCASPAMGCSTGYVINSETGAVVLTCDWFKEKYGLLIDETRIVFSVSEDNNVYFGLKAQFTTLGISYIPWYYVVDPELYNSEN